MHSRPSPTRPLSPQEVLACFRYWHRLSTELDPQAVLTFDMTIAEWRDVGELVSEKRLGAALNATFGTAFTREEWQAVLTPPCRKTLRDVCNLIASAARTTEIKPWSFLGKKCWAAGAFHVVKDMLAQRGVAVSELRPSSVLAPYARAYPDLFLIELPKLAPGKMPPCKIEKRGYDACFWILVAGVAGLIGSSFTGNPWHSIVSVITVGGGYLGMWIFSKLPPNSVQFEGLDTFRDLCRLLTSVADEQAESGAENRSKPILEGQ